MLVMHIFILGAGFWIAQHGAPVAALGALVLVKTAIDFFTHRRAHNEPFVIPAPRPRPASPSAVPGRATYGPIRILIGVAIVVGFAIESGLVSEVRDLANPPAKRAPAPPLPPPTAWQTNTQGWEIPLPRNAPAAGIAGRGTRVTKEGNGWRVAFDHILIEKNPTAPDQQVTGIAAHYDRRVGGGGSSGISTEALAVRLTAETPFHTLPDHSFDFTGSADCARTPSPCRFWLEVRSVPATVR